MNKKIAVIGARGMLGCDLVPCLEKTGHQVIALDLPEFDLTKPEYFEKNLAGAGTIINCAAFTNVDGAEQMRDMAMQVNAEAVGLLGKFARRENIHVIHISTDFVFDGKSNRPYLETDKPNPINVYGVSKLKGEELLAQSGCRYAIMRVQWSYGKNGVNFISKILERARKGGVLKVVDDQTGSPTWTCDMARVICCLLHSQAGGLYHFADAGYASRFEVARFVVQKLGLSNALIPCSSSDFPVKARRPANSSFNTGKIQGVLDHKIRSWQDALSAYLAVTPLADISRIH